MYKLPMFLYDTKSVYQMDKAAVESDGLPGISLMQRAGERVWREISSRWPESTRITIFAGSGNNGGDAFVVAILAKQQGKQVQFIVRGDLSRQSETSAHFRKIWQQGGGDIIEWNAQEIIGEVIVDGLLGIGLTRELDQDWQALIQQINQVDAIRVAIDIPSGLNANTGIAQPCAVEADLTVTFIGAKVGQYLADGPDFCGELLYDDLGVSSRTSRSQMPALCVIDRCNVVLPAKRKRNSHKNKFGHVLIIGGDRGMSGAASLAAQTALRGGAGLVTVLVHPECVHDLSTIPELMVQSWDDIDKKLEQATVIVIGPGLGQSEAAKYCLAKLHTWDKPIVVDASALESGFLTALESAQVVITPHPGEAAKLLSTTPVAIQFDRLSASRQLVEKFAAVCVLKGSGSIIQQAGSIAEINLRGNPGMAVAGMGDVLAGLIAALLGQKLSPFDAAKTGVLIHALCAENYAVSNDESGLIASDIIARIPSILMQLR
jgi:NAD(P)H-hydrate epimerase